MKYVIVIPDGAADTPLDDLDGLTPFQAADTPALDALANSGRQGLVRTTPPGFGASSDVCCMTLFGYDAATHHTGRAPLEAAAAGIDLGPRDWVFRTNLVTTSEAWWPSNEPPGLMVDHSAGHISDAEARALLGDLAAAWHAAEPELAEGLELRAGVSYRHLLADRSGRDFAGDAGAPPLTTTPPHEIPGRPWAQHTPSGAHAEGISRLMRTSRDVFERHEVNRARIDAGLRPATMAWIWGQGTRPDMQPFTDRFGLRGSIITAVDLLAGLARSIGWDRLPVPGITGYHDTDYDAKGRYAIGALDRYDLVVVHVEAPDEASHQADWQTKVASIEAIDRHVIAPIAAHLRSAFGDNEADPDAEGWRMLVLPDHYTLVDTRRHDPTPVPFAMAGSWVRSVLRAPFSEHNAADADLTVDPGHQLMEYFLFSGLKVPRSQRRPDRPTRRS